MKKNIEHHTVCWQMNGLMSEGVRVIFARHFSAQNNVVAFVFCSKEKLTILRSTPMVKLVYERQTRRDKSLILIIIYFSVCCVWAPIAPRGVGI